ncbi:porin [Bosea sp. LjRoot9]|uniref:porin n=1 Tax=Bosea sp. LjRoot9 TaxID=3342341 RepID=UPI003ECD03C4
MSRNAALLALFISTALIPNAQAAGRPPSFLRSCVIAAPDPVPLFPPSAAARARSASDGEEKDGANDTADDDEDEAEDSPRGFLSPGSSTCIAISGTVNAGPQRDDYRANALTRATGQVPLNATSFPLNTTFRIETGQSLANGLFLASAFEFSIDTSSNASGDVTLSEASVTLGPLSFGVAGSRFDFWAGDDFAFVGRIPSRTVAIIGYERQLTESLSLSISAEDVSIDQRTPLPSAGRRMPDGVARLLYQHDTLTLHGAVAMRDVPRIGASSLVGRAAVLGATWDGSVLKKPLTLSAQIAGAVNAAPYIGSQLDRRVAFPLLSGDEATRGWSGVVSIGRGWTDEWSSNAYISRYELTLPRIGGEKGRIRIDRVAANVVWKPLKGLRIGLEASLAWQRIDLAGPALAASFNGRQSSAQLFLERTF